MQISIAREISHGQLQLCGKFRDSTEPQGLWDISAMNSTLNIQAIRDMIDKEMQAKGFSRRSLSSAAGLSGTAVRDVLERTENPGIGTLHKIAEALQIPIESITSEGVPVMGSIGAGGSIGYFSDDHEFTTVPRPPLAPGPIMALRVKGESMLPKYEPGDIVYVMRNHDGILPSYLGRHCAVHAADGGTYLKILSAGSTPDRFTLRSLNAADMNDIEVIWASPVLFVMPNNAVFPPAMDQ